jgi:hypothetical protein
MEMEFEDIDYWKAIILYGLNQATYKIALGKTILELAQAGHESVEWSVLSKAYLDNFITRLSKDAKPQQSNSARRTVMERIVGQLNNNTISYDEAIRQVEEYALNDVVPRFQTIGTSKELVGDKFYHFDHGKKLY